MRHERRKSDKAQGGSPAIRILAVDDDRTYLSFLRLILKRAGFTVEVAANGESAINRIRRAHDVDLILIDLAMPGLDGIETVRRLRVDQQSTVYAILLTAFDGTEVKLRALESGLDDFLPKTAGSSEIVAKIRSAARRVEMERKLHTEKAELEALALTDALTGVANRRALFSAGEALLGGGRKVATLILDVDQFKQVNDLHGHLAGDRVLASIARSLKETTRVGDLIARYGGDEFVVLLPDTGEREARTIGRRITQAISELEWRSAAAASPFRVTAMLGVAVATAKTPRDLTDLLAAADAELIAAKRNARENAASMATRPRRRAKAAELRAQ